MSVTLTEDAIQWLVSSDQECADMIKENTNIVKIILHAMVADEASFVTSG